MVEQAIQSATETAVMILRIDDVISSKSRHGDEMGDMGDFHMFFTIIYGSKKVSPYGRASNLQRRGGQNINPVSVYDSSR